ncbi:carbohydrate kinase family protein [Microbacterium sp. MC2]
MNRVVVAGHVCVDLTPSLRTLSIEPGRLSTVGPLSVALGGSVANTGRALVALGHDVELAARVGTDELGRIAGHLLRSSGLHGVPTVSAEAGTSYSIVIEPQGTDRSFWHYVGANELFDGSEVTVDAEIVHLGYPSLLPRLVADGGVALRVLLQRARQVGAVTSVDLAVVDDATMVDWESVLRDAMPQIDVITPSADDLRSALRQPRATAPDLVEMLLDWGAAVATVSDGPRGMSLGVAGAGRLAAAGETLARLAGDWADSRVYQPTSVLRQHTTTNGAGDAATAGILSGILRGESPPETTARAARTAAAVIEGDLLGAYTIPTRDGTTSEAQ